MNVFQCFRGDAASIVYYDQVQDFFLHVNPHPDQTALRLWLQTVLYCVFHHGLQNEWGDQQLFRIALGTNPPVQLHSFPKSSLLNLKVFPGNAHFICKGGRGGIAPKTMPEYLGQGENQPFGFSGLFQASYPAYGIQGVKKKVGIDLAAKTLQFGFLCQFLTFQNLGLGLVEQSQRSVVFH